MAIIEEPLVQAIERLRAQHNDDADYEAKKLRHDTEQACLGKCECVRQH